MFMHSCWCIIFIVLSEFCLNSKLNSKLNFKVDLKGFGKFSFQNSQGKMNVCPLCSFCPLVCFPAFLACSNPQTSFIARGSAAFAFAADQRMNSFAFCHSHAFAERAGTRSSARQAARRLHLVSVRETALGELAAARSLSPCFPHVESWS
jgi:hypothetical protein